VTLVGCIAVGCCCCCAMAPKLSAASRNVYWRGQAVATNSAHVLLVYSCLTLLPVAVTRNTCRYVYERLKLPGRRVTCTPSQALV
jgi:glucose-6-phosphate-specific signal transduction histidine kinase